VRLIALSTVILSVFVLQGTASAVQPRRIGAGTYNKQAAVAAYGRAVYPKYYGGFHAREFQNIGVPHGDIGILGNGIQRNPW